MTSKGIQKRIAEQAIADFKKGRVRREATLSTLQSTGMTPEAAEFLVANAEKQTGER